MHSLGTAILRARFKAGTKELSVSLYQAVVLLLFNETTEIPFVDIKEQTNIGEISMFLLLIALTHFMTR
jgi:cullin-4